MSLHQAISGLTSDQLAAVTSDISKSLMIIAGPGSGKTHTLTLRVAYMLNKNISAKNILVSTFTRKAADEMKKRLASVIPLHLEVESLALGTFHHCALSILRANANKVGLPFDFKIASVNKQRKIIQEVLKEYLKTDVFENLVLQGVRTLSEEQISSMMEEYQDQEDKVKGSSVSYVLSIICKGKIDRACLKTFTRPLFRVFDGYNQKLRQNGLIDMSDIMFMTCNLFENWPQVLETYQNKYKYIIVDEFQDTNSVQLDFLKMVGKKSCITVCGDDDQAIYGWRGANIEIFEEFKRMKDCSCVVLCQNFRSTQEVVLRSSNLINFNQARTEKKFRTSNSEGSPVKVIISDTARKEINSVKNEIKNLIGKGREYKDIAILYRLNRVGNEFIAELKEEVPVTTGHKHSFFDRSEINLVNYLKVISDPTDNISLYEILNWPKRSFGDSAKLRLKNTASIHSLTYYQALEYLVRQSTGKGLKAYFDLYSLLSPFVINIESYSAFEILHRIISKYSLPVPKTLIKLSENFKEKGSQSIRDFLDFALKNENKNAVCLSTIHQAKGQEWKVVFLVRANEGILPVLDDVEEERRLAYVAATRAKEMLFLTCCLTDSNGERVVPSRFLEEFFVEKTEKREMEAACPTKQIKIANVV